MRDESDIKEDHKRLASDLMNGKYTGVELLEAWLVTKEEGKRATGGRFT